MVEKIIEYLSRPEADQDYDEGLILLSRSSKNRILIQFLGRKKKQSKLLYELNKIAKKLQTKPVPASIETTAKKGGGKKGAKAKELDLKDKSVDITGVDFSEEPGKLRVISPDRKINLEDLPEDLQEKWKRNAAMYKEARSLHEKLKLLVKGTDKQRAPVIQKLNQITETIRENWNAIDMWIPGVSVTEPKTDPEPVDWKRVNSNKKYISSNMAKLEHDPKNKELKTNIQQRVNELLTAGHKFSEDQVERLKNLKIEMGADKK